MKRMIRTGLLSLGLAALPLGFASAQEPISGYEGGRQVAPGTRTDIGRSAKHWGLFGLFGLAGLAGLMRRREEAPGHRTTYRTGEPLGSR